MFASAVTIKPQDPSMSATSDTHNLEKLLSGYGIDHEEDAVLDLGSTGIVTTSTGGVSAIRHPGIAHVVDDPRFDDKDKLLGHELRRVLPDGRDPVSVPSTLELLRDKQPSDVKLYAVARTTQAARKRVLPKRRST